MELFPEGEQRGRVRRASGGGGPECTVSGIPRETFQPGDLEFPQISAPARPPRPACSPSGITPATSGVDKARWGCQQWQHLMLGACVGGGGGVGVGHAAVRLLGRHVARVAACRLRGAGLQGPGAGVPGAAARRGLHGTRAAQQRKPVSPWWGRSPAVQVRQRRNLPPAISLPSVYCRPLPQCSRARLRLWPNRPRCAARARPASLPDEPSPPLSCCGRCGRRRRRRRSWRWRAG